jgi:hypothetical protein
MRAAPLNTVVGESCAYGNRGRADSAPRLRTASARKWPYPTAKMLPIIAELGGLPQEGIREGRVASSARAHGDKLHVRPPFLLRRIVPQDRMPYCRPNAVLRHRSQIRPINPQKARPLSRAGHCHERLNRANRKNGSRPSLRRARNVPQAPRGEVPYVQVASDWRPTERPRVSIERDFSGKGRTHRRRVRVLKVPDADFPITGRGE